MGRNLKNLSGVADLRDRFRSFYQLPDPYKTQTRYFEKKRIINTLAMLPADRTFCKVLDLGCGEGEFTGQLAHRAEEIIGIDFAEPAIARAKERWGSKISFQLSDTATFVTEASGFDLVCCIVSLEYVEDKKTVLRRISCALRSGGLFLVVGACPKKLGYLDRGEWMDLLSRDFEILESRPISPAIRGHKILHSRYFPFRMITYDLAMLLAKAWPDKFCRHIGFLCQPRKT